VTYMHAIMARRNIWHGNEGNDLSSRTRQSPHARPVAEQRGHTHEMCSTTTLYRVAIVLE